MFNKKIIIVIIVAVLIFTSSAVLGFLWKTNSSQPVDKIISNGAGPARPAKPILNQEGMDNLKELSKNHPEFSPVQLSFYNDLAAKGIVDPCDSRSDTIACVSSVAFILGRSFICGDIEENDNAQIECANAILDKIAESEIKKCDAMSNLDLKTECLVDIFRLYKKPSHCSNLIVAAVRKKCEAVAYYQQAILTGNRNLCSAILDEYLKSYCKKI